MCVCVLSNCYVSRVYPLKIPYRHLYHVIQRGGAPFLHWILTSYWSNQTVQNVFLCTWSSNISELVFCMKIGYFIGYWLLSHWKCVGNLADQNRFWLDKCWNWSDNGQWPTRDVPILVLAIVSVGDMLLFYYISDRYSLHTADISSDNRACNNNFI